MGCCRKVPIEEVKHFLKPVFIKRNRYDSGHTVIRDAARRAVMLRIDYWPDKMTLETLLNKHLKKGASVKYTSTNNFSEI